MCSFDAGTFVDRVERAPAPRTFRGREDHVPGHVHVRAILIEGDQPMTRLRVPSVAANAIVSEPPVARVHGLVVEHFHRPLSGSRCTPSDLRRRAPGSAFARAKRAGLLGGSPW